MNVKQHILRFRVFHHQRVPLAAMSLDRQIRPILSER